MRHPRPHLDLLRQPGPHCKGHQHDRFRVLDLAHDFLRLDDRRDEDRRHPGLHRPIEGDHHLRNIWHEQGYPGAFAQPQREQGIGKTVDLMVQPAVRQAHPFEQDRRPGGKHPHRRAQHMMNRDIGDGDRKRHPRLVVRQPGTRLAQRVTLGFLFGNVVGGAAPGALAFAFEEALDGPIHCIAPLQHDHVTRRPDIRILRPGDGLRHLGEQRLLKDCIAVAADDECRHFETLEPLPARPF